MYLTKNNHISKLQENALMNHTDVKGLFKKLEIFKPHRIPYEIILKLVDIDGVGIDICPYGDLVYNTNYSNYSGTYKKIKYILESNGYWIARFTGTIFKDLSDNRIESIGEVR